MRHLRASKSTRSSRSLTSCLLFLAFVAGCAKPAEVSVPSQSVQPAAVKQNKVEFDPQSQSLSLLFDSQRIYLGDTKEETVAHSNPPRRKWEFTNLPPLLGDSFSALGWEADNGYSFGCIAFTDPGIVNAKDAVVQAMLTRDDVDQKTVDETVAEYTSAFGPPVRDDTPYDARVGYWFWNAPGRRLMVCAALDAKGKRSLTVALGAPMLMTFLGMSPEQAKADKAKSVQHLNEQDVH